MSRRTNTCQLDHRGDPEPPAAAAPTRKGNVRVTGPGARRIAFQRGDTPHAARTEPQADTYGRCRAAAALEVPWSEDREDCAADLFLKLLDEHGVTPPAVKYGNGRRRRPAKDRRDVTAVPRNLDAARLTKLRWLARNWAKARKLERDRLLLDAAGPGAVAAALVIDPEPPDGTVRGLAPATAERLADGLADHLTAAGSAPSRRRDVAAAVYALLRDVTTDVAASETGRTPSGYREAARRGRAALVRAFPTPRDLFEALLLLDPVAREARTRTHMLAKDWRAWQAIDAPVTTRRRRGRRKPRHLDDTATAALARDARANRAAAAKRYRLGGVPGVKVW